MSVLSQIDRIPTEDGSVRFLCHLESDIGVIKKSVAVTAEFIQSSNRAQARDEILRQISQRSKEADRHAEFYRVTPPLGMPGPHKNPKELWQHKEDTKLHDKVTRGEVERLLNEALNA